MNKKSCIIIQIIVLVWFFLAMIGVRLGSEYLVTSAFVDDWYFFVIYLIAVLLFIFKEKIGKWAMTIWLSMWFITQFLAHEWYTIFNSGLMGTMDSKIEYFSNTIHWLNIDRYVPDLYHTILHILILMALIVTIMYIKRSKKEIM